MGRRHLKGCPYSGVHLLSASIGIAEYPSDGDNVNILMQHTDVAMYVSKRNKLAYSIYNPDEDHHSLQRLDLKGDLQNAIDNKTIEIHYQPKLYISTGEVYGAEALLRWKHPVSGYLSPEKIIEIAEHGGLIDDLTELIIDKAITDFLRLDDRFRHLNLAINLSVHNLRNDSLYSNVNSVLQRQSIDPSHITFEVTEGEMMADPEKSIEVLNKLTELGVQISIDDFGTGFSSLAYLKKLPVSELKIDKSFVSDMVTDNSDAVIVKSTIDLGHNLDLSIVAEGVESKEAFNMLKVMGCDLVQGYYFARPLKFADFSNWLDSRSILSSAPSAKKVN